MAEFYREKKANDKLTLSLQMAKPKTTLMNSFALIS